MSARFAGSRSVDERRRRRLATDSEEFSDQDAPLDSESAHDIPDEHAQRTNFYPIGTLLPKTFWKACLCATLMLIVGGGVIYLGILSALQPTRMRPEWQPYLNLSQGPLVTWLSGTLLLLAGQIAFLIGWARSRSIQDFSGRYRTWKFIACGLLFASLCAGTGLHELLGWHLGGLLAQHLQIPLTQQTHLGWFLPAFVLGAIMMTRLDRELRGHFLGLHCIWVAALMSSLTGLLPLEIYPAAYQHIIPAAAALAAQLLLFTGLFLHLRFVIHVCPDPATVRSLKLRLFKLSIPKFRLPRLRKTKSESASQKAAPDKSRKSSKQEKTQPAAKSSTVSANEADQSDWQELEEQATRKPRNKRRSRQNNIRIDQAEEEIPEPKSLKQEQPIDPEMLKGLSKRERRKLRKQMRDEQRANKRNQYS